MRRSRRGGRTDQMGHRREGRTRFRPSTLERADQRHMPSLDIAAGYEASWRFAMTPIAAHPRSMRTC